MTIHQRTCLLDQVKLEIRFFCLKSKNHMSDFFYTLCGLIQLPVFLTFCYIAFKIKYFSWLMFVKINPMVFPRLLFFSELKVIRNTGLKSVFLPSWLSSVNQGPIYSLSLNTVSTTPQIPNITESHQEGTNIDSGKGRLWQKCGGRKYKRKEWKCE